MKQFEKDTLYRLLVEASRFWLIGHFLRTHALPDPAVYFVYANGPNGLDWGNEPGPDDPQLKPLRRKRVRITLEIEDH